MDYEEFMTESPENVRKIIKKAMDIYDRVDRYDRFESYQLVDSIQGIQKYAKIDRMAGALFLACLMVPTHCQKLMNDAGVKKEPVLKWFELEEDEIQCLSEEQYRKYFDDRGMSFLLEHIQCVQYEYEGELSNATFLPEYILLYFMTDEYFRIGIIGELFDAMGWTSIEEILDHPAVDMLSRLVAQTLRVRKYIEKDSLLFESTSLPTLQKDKPRAEKSDLLQQYGMYLTEQTFLSNPAIGREAELKQLMLSILTPTKATMVVGEAAVGKTALVRGLAYLIQNQQVPDLLKDISIVQINVSSLVSGSIYRGMLEERLETIMDELIQHPKTILFMDEIHTMVGGGDSAEGSLDLANLLKPYLNDQRIQMIGATTIEEYEKIVMTDSAFKRRFERITVEEPKKETVREILQGTILSLEQITKVRFDFEKQEAMLILDSVVDATDKKYRDYYDAVNNPDLALSLLEKSFAYAAYEGASSVQVDHIAESIRMCQRLAKDARNRHADQLLHRFDRSMKEVAPTYGKVLVFPKKQK